MTQLLISVKNVEEALVARYADVDVIDLKDPSVGALGALDVEMVKQIVSAVEGGCLISATIGEGHRSIDALVNDIRCYADLKVDVIKIAVNDLFNDCHFMAEIKQVTSERVKLVAVLFAENTLDLNLLAKLQEAGFYGVMLDTQLKQRTLLDLQPIEQLKSFVESSEKYQLISGLAGSVSSAHVNTLSMLNPTFIGLRGGVCQNKQRTSTLLPSKVTEVKGLLLNCNISQSKKPLIRGLSLHI